MATNIKILGVYTALSRPPRRFAIHSQNGFRRETYDIYRSSTVKDCLFSLLGTLSANDPGFLAKLEKLDDSGFLGRKQRTRRYIARDKEVLYIESPHLAEKYAEKYDQYWLATNIGWKEARTIVNMTCKAAGLKYGSLSAVKF